MEFKHFSPIGTVTPNKIIPNFTGNLDVFTPSKNIARFEELAASFGLQSAKRAILKNTLRFAETAQVAGSTTLKKNGFGAQQFPAANGNTMPVLGHNIFGFPIYSNLVIKGDSYTDNFGKVIASFNDIRLDAVILEVERHNHIIVTDIQGRANSVIEYVGSRSPRIHVYGTILADIPGVYPEADVAELMRALASNRALRVESWFLAMAGIYNMVVDKDSIKQEPGSQEYQKFEFDAIADAPIILKILPAKPV